MMAHVANAVALPGAELAFGGVHPTPAIDRRTQLPIAGPPPLPPTPAARPAPLVCNAMMCLAFDVAVCATLTVSLARHQD
jgi:hypothetical protein